MRFRFGCAVLAVGALVLAGSGCEDDSHRVVNQTVTDPTVSDDVGGETTLSIIGRVVRRELSGGEFGFGQGDGIDDVVVSLMISPSSVKTARTRGSSGGGFDEAGWFEMDDIHLHESGIFRLRLTHPDFGTRNYCVFLPAKVYETVREEEVVVNEEGSVFTEFVERQQIVSHHTVDVGILEMGAGADLDVVVTIDGVLTSGVRVFAIEGDFAVWYGYGSLLVDPRDLEELDEFFEINESPADCGFTQYAATTGADGIARFENLDSTSVYTIVVPARDLDGDGRWDYESEFRPYFEPLGNRPTTVAIPLESHEFETPGILLRGDNFTDVPESWSGSSGVIVDPTSLTLNTGDEGDNVVNEDVTSSGEGAFNGSTVVQVFRFPVVVAATGGASDPFFEYLDDLVDPATGYEEDPTVADLFSPRATRIDATVQSFANGTVWVFTPASALPVNETVTLRYAARDPRTSNDWNDFAETFYVSDPAPLTAASMTLDNYNGTSAATGASTTYIEFPEAVFGFYQVLSITRGTVTETILDPSANSLAFNDVVFTSGNAGTTTPRGNVGVGAGKFFRYFLDSDDLEDGDEVEIYISAEDVDGNRFEGTFTRTVQ